MDKILAITCAAVFGFAALHTIGGGLPPVIAAGLGWFIGGRLDTASVFHGNEQRKIYFAVVLVLFAAVIYALMN